MLQHIVGHARQIPLGLPTPLLARTSVVQRIGPTLGNLFLNRIDIVIHHEPRNALFDFGIDDFGRETHRCQIEAVAVTKFRRVGLHQLDARTQRIGHVNHIHVDVRRHRTGEPARLDRLIIDFDGIVGRTATGQGDIGNDARETHRTGVDTIFMVVIITEQFARDFADTIDGRRLHDGILRGFLFGRRRTERTDGTRREQCAMMLTGHLERIVERTHIDVPSHLGIALADRRKQRHQVEYRIDPMTGDDRSHRRSIQRIEDFERARFAERLAFAHIGRNDMRIAVNFTEVNCQFGTDLAAGTYNEDSFHRVEVVNSKVKIENNREKCAKFWSIHFSCVLLHRKTRELLL